MRDLANYAAAFDYFDGATFDFKKPTKSSLSVIQKHFDFQFPEDLIEFSSISKRYGAWFASFGEDYDNGFHVIRVNAGFRSQRRRVGGSWRNIFPRQLVVINHGHDDDCDCIDTQDVDDVTGENAFYYWSPELEVPEKRTASFKHYLENHIGGKLDYYERQTGFSHSNKTRETALKIIADVNELLG